MQGNFSKDTFDKLKHYVGVRLQQGVPIVDADWNELADIRKYELQAFLKWFVGNGVPYGNDGFGIVPIQDKLILTSKSDGIEEPQSGSDPEIKVKKSSLEINLADSTAAEALGFGPNNYRAVRAAPPAAQLTGDAGNFPLENGMTLKIGVDGKETDTIIFDANDFVDIGAATTAEVVAAINKSATNFTASAGDAEDFDIKGGDGTAAGTGRCLVDGWEAVNESNIRYTAQLLYGKESLCEKLGVPELNALSPGKAVAYLDLWERVVPSEEDPNPVYEKIGVESCIRHKLDWVVRVDELEGDSLVDWKPPDAVLEKLKNHAFYPLALLSLQSEATGYVSLVKVTDLRRVGLSMGTYHDMRQIVTDAYGGDYVLDNDGLPNLKFSLRETINILLKGGLPSTPKIQLSDAYPIARPIFVLEDDDGDAWLFYSVLDRTKYRRYKRSKKDWEPENELEYTGGYQNGLKDGENNIWLFWSGGHSDRLNIYFQYYDSGEGIWQDYDQLTDTEHKEIACTAILDNEGKIWAFWHSEIDLPEPHPDVSFIWYNYRFPPPGDWEEKHIQLPTGNVGAYKDWSPHALKDDNGAIWVFWVSNRDNAQNIYALRKKVGDNWEDPEPVTVDEADDKDPVAVLDKEGNIWLFWLSDTTANQRYQIYYKRYLKSTGHWDDGATCLAKDNIDKKPAIGVDSEGDIWVFWHHRSSPRDNSVWYKRYNRVAGWSHARQLLEEIYESADWPVVLGYRTGGIWSFWSSNSSDGSGEAVWHKRLIPAI